MVSIIIPLYNRADTIADCLESILAQTYEKFEVIIVNDGSSDNSLEIAKSFENKFWSRKIRFKILSQSNQGAPSARNKGFREAQGKYLFFCDSDATLKKEALERLVKKLKANPNASYVYSSFMWGRKKFIIGEFSAEKLKQGPMVHTMSLIHRQDFPESGWDESIKKLQDWDLYLTMLENNKTGIWLNEVLFQIKPGGTMSDWLPGLAYKLFPFLPAVKKYKKAVKIIKNKYNLK